MSISQGFSAKTRHSASLSFRQAEHDRQVAAAKETMENEALPKAVRNIAKREYKRLTTPTPPKVDGVMTQTVVPPERIALTEQHREVAEAGLTGFQILASHEYASLQGNGELTKVSYCASSPTADEAWVTVKIRRPQNIDTLEWVFSQIAALDTELANRVAIDAELLARLRDPAGTDTP